MSDPHPSHPAHHVFKAAARAAALHKHAQTVSEAIAQEAQDAQKLALAPPSPIPQDSGP